MRLINFPLFFFNDTATTDIYTLSLHDALPISQQAKIRANKRLDIEDCKFDESPSLIYADRKSTRLNSSHPSISYAVFCLKKKNEYVQEAHKCLQHLIPMRNNQRLSDSIHFISK